MIFKISEHIKKELNKISFLLKLSYYKWVLPKGPLMKMLDEAPVTWEEATWVNINKDPRKVTKSDFDPNQQLSEGSLYDFEDDILNRVSFELYGKLDSLTLPIKIRVDREKGNDSYNYSLFIKGKSDYELISRPKNLAKFSEDLFQLNELVKNKNLDEIDYSDVKDKTTELLNSFSNLVSRPKNKEIMKFILDTYEKKEKQKPLYLFKFVPEKQLKDKVINLNFDVEKDVKEDSKKRNSEYEKKIADILQEYINNKLSDKIDLDKFIFSYKPGKLFGIKVKVK
jgi:hypothetical protein